MKSYIGGKNILSCILSLFSAGVFAAGVNDSNRAELGGDMDLLRSGFANPPASARPLTWWHWINGSVSKEGIVKDFEGLKNAGVAGVQLLNANMYVPDGHLRFHSEDWFDYVNFAIQKADEYGLEFYIMNADGWANSGGPWITPEKSMKRLIWSETPISSKGGRVSVELKMPSGIKEDFYKDYCTLVVPAADSDGEIPNISTSDSGKTFDITFEYKKPVERRIFHFTVNAKGQPTTLIGWVSVSADGKNFKKLRDFRMEGRITDVNLTLAFPQTKSKYFKVSIPKNVAKLKFFDHNKYALSNSSIVDMAKSKSLSLNGGGMKNVMSKAADNEDTAGALKLDQILDATKSVSEDGVLSMNLPAGKWVAIRFGYTSTGAKNHPCQPEGHGLEVDKMSQEHTLFHMESSLGRTIKESKNYIGKSFKGILLDSWEVGSQNWTEKMPDIFKERRGYDIKKFLVACTGRAVISPAVSDAFLSDFRRTISEAVAGEYFGGVRKFSNSNGLVLYGEPYGGACFNEMAAADNLDFVMSEFWVERININSTVPFGGSKTDKNRGFYSIATNHGSNSHITGRKVFGAESFTAVDEAGMWAGTPKRLKLWGDAAYNMGINRFIFHTTAHQPNDLKPGFSLGRYGTHFGRANTWWKDAKVWTDYLSRSQFLLQSGLPVAQILVLRTDDINQYHQPSMVLLPSGYLSENCTLEFFKNCSVKDSKMVSPYGMSFDAIVTERDYSVDLGTLKKLAEAKAAGIPIIGVKPSAPDNLLDATKNYEEWKSLAEEVFGPSDKSTHAWEDVQSALEGKGIGKDFNAVPHKEGEKLYIGFSHRRYGKSDIYFVANQSLEGAASFTASFAVSGKIPQLWDAVSGAITPVVAYEDNGKSTSFDLRLARNGSIFVVFDAGDAKENSPVRIEQASSSERVPESFETYETLPDGTLILYKSGLCAVSKDGSRTPLEPVKAIPEDRQVKLDSWKVKFVSPFDETFTLSFPKLKSWGDFLNTKIKYFSGTGTYYIPLEISADEISEGSRVVLDLGEVWDLATIRLNGKKVCTLWTYPYSADITEFLKAGTNELEIDVTNNWQNRMIGDELLKQDTKYNMKGSKFTIGRLAEFPEWYGDAKKTAARERKTWAIWKHFDGTEKTRDAGLIGPIVLKFGAEAKK